MKDMEQRRVREEGAPPPGKMLGAWRVSVVIWVDDGLGSGDSVGGFELGICVGGGR